jgi:hypothetical protein
MAKKNTQSKRDLRNLRIQQIVFLSIGVIVILRYKLSLVLPNEAVIPKPC